MDISGLSAGLASGVLSSKELVLGCLNKINAYDHAENVYITVLADEAQRQAEEIDRRRLSGEKLPPLAGIPFALADNICTKGVKTTCGSEILGSFTPGYSAFAAKQLAENGAVLVGKLNMDEFGINAGGEGSAFGAVRNPKNASFAAFALGADSGGGACVSSSFCGAVGIKPTYGRVSRFGLAALVPSMEQIAPVTANVRDAALVLQAIAGRDKSDATSAQKAVPSYTADIEKGVSGMRFAVPRQVFCDNLDNGVKEAFLAAAKRLEDLGAKLEEVDMPFLKDAPAAYQIIAAAEASSSLGRYNGVNYGVRAEEYSSIEDMYKKTRGRYFGSAAKELIMFGTFVLSKENYESYYVSACKIRASIIQGYAEIFSRYDAVITPTTPYTAPGLGKASTTANSGAESWRDSIYTAPPALAGLPAISVPCGAGANGMPIGFQLVGSAFCEETLFKAAYALEQAKGGVQNV